MRLLGCSKWFVVHWCLVARVFWVVARWLLTEPNEKTTHKSFLGVLSLKFQF